MAGDANYDSVSLLLHGDGSNGSTTFTDSGPAALAPSSVGGTIAITTAQSKFGGASLNARRTGELIYNSSGFAFGTGDFTIECFAYFSTALGTQQYGAFQISTAGGFSTSTSNNISLFAYTGNVWALYSSGAGAKTSSLVITTGVWYHVAISRTSGVTKLFVDGVQILSFADTYNYTGTYAVIGAYYSTAYRMDGYLDEIRVTKGVGRYTADFTPPTQAFDNFNKQVSGVVRDDTGALCARVVRAYDRATGALLSSTTSNAATGAYTLNTGDGEVQIVVLDDAAGTLYNDLVNRVIPV